jgi:tripartite-type tricarboxylate transporter receptor subunit TctC
MQIVRRKFLRLGVAATVAPVLSSLAWAQAYPSKPIKLILPFQPGTPNDVIARLIAPALSSRLGQAVVVDNRPGGGTLIGTKAAMTAEADGHTLLVTSTSVHVVAQNLTGNIAYDPISDFAAVASIGTASWVLVISPAVPAKSLAEFLAYEERIPAR